MDGSTNNSSLFQNINYIKAKLIIINLKIMKNEHDRVNNII